VTELDLSLYFVTDFDQAAAAGRSVEGTVAAAIAGGVTAIQVREKKRSASEFVEVLCNLSHVVPVNVALFVNDRVDVFLAARACGAHVTGIHLGHNDLPLSCARALVGRDVPLGLSASTEEEVRTATLHEARPAYLGVASVRATDTKARCA
jgi:thiamine-phosphate pyrophosphorylase